MKIAKEVGKFEMKHKLLFFMLVLIATILIVRFSIAYIFDPNPKILGLELHHFDYGLLLLIVTVLFMLFVGKYERAYLALCSIAIALIVDELWFIRKQIGGNNPEIYNPSFPYAIILAMIIVFLAFLLSSLFKKKK
ncbi:MAG: hypothetical protein KKB21_04590 [Nanoarchaeota archaeon]|nr:hypothetical protein [Nanoarchaeota archaeon]MBU4086824.1 hypothetical protein [Nanoarchaeota archaeon]